MKKESHFFKTAKNKPLLIAYYVLIFAACTILIYGLFTAFYRPFFVYKKGSPSAAAQNNTLPAEPVMEPRINVNKATLKELQLLPAIGPTTAQEIILSRESQGPFHYPEDLLAVKGIGEKTLDKIRPYLVFD